MFLSNTSRKSAFKRFLKNLTLITLIHLTIQTHKCAQKQNVAKVSNHIHIHISKH